MKKERVKVKFKPTFLSYIIKTLDENDTTHIVIYGEQGAGKTSYALWTLFSVFRSWRKALDHLVFTNEEFQRLLDENKDSVIEAIILDDAGTHLSRRTWWQSDVLAFEKWMNIVRGRVKSLIFTTPFNDLPSFILSKIPLEILVYKTSTKIGGIPLSQARIYKKFPLPGFREFRKLLYVQFYPRYYPSKIYKEYMKRRRETIERLEERAQLIAEIKADVEKCLLNASEVVNIIRIPQTRVRKLFRYVTSVKWGKERLFPLDSVLEIAKRLDIPESIIIERIKKLGYKMENLERGGEVIEKIKKFRSQRITELH